MGYFLSHFFFFSFLFFFLSTHVKCIDAARHVCRKRNRTTELLRRERTKQVRTVRKKKIVPRDQVDCHLGEEGIFRCRSSRFSAPRTPSHRIFPSPSRSLVYYFVDEALHVRPLLRQVAMGTHRSSIPRNDACACAAKSKLSPQVMTQSNLSATLLRFQPSSHRPLMDSRNTSTDDDMSHCHTPPQHITPSSRINSMLAAGEELKKNAIESYYVQPVIK